MACQNAKWILLFVTVSVLFVQGDAYAKSKKALWRVVAEEEGRAAPTNIQKKTPFLMRPAPIVPVKKVEKKRPRVSLADLEMKRKSKRAAELLTNIKEILSQEYIFRPDVSKIAVSARLRGVGGYRILVNNVWIGIGDYIAVPAVANDEIWDLVDELEVVDKSLGEDVQGEIESKVSAARDLSLQVTDITIEKLTLKDEEGELHSLSLEFLDN